MSVRSCLLTSCVATIEHLERWVLEALLLKWSILSGRCWRVWIPGLEHSQCHLNFWSICTTPRRKDAKHL